MLFSIQRCSSQNLDQCRSSGNAVAGKRWCVLLGGLTGPSGCALRSVKGVRRTVGPPPRIIESEVATLKETLRQGATGLAWDNVAWSGPWRFDLTEVRCPVSLWYGASDPLAPPFHGEWFKAHLPNVVEFVVSQVSDTWHLCGTGGRWCWS